jgi:hypothetical protein
VGPALNQWEDFPDHVISPVGAIGIHEKYILASRKPKQPNRNVK